MGCTAAPCLPDNGGLPLFMPAQVGGPAGRGGHLPDWPELSGEGAASAAAEPMDYELSAVGGYTLAGGSPGMCMQCMTSGQELAVCMAPTPFGLADPAPACPGSSTLSSGPCNSSFWCRWRRQGVGCGRYQCAHVSPVPGGASL